MPKQIYPILQPPINRGGILFDKTIPLTPEEAAPMLKLGVIGEATGEAPPEPPPEQPPVEVEVSIAEKEVPPAVNLDTVEFKEVPTKINLNTAELEALAALEGIGDTVASKLVEQRPYASLDAARLVAGLTKDKWKKIEPLLTLQ